MKIVSTTIELEEGDNVKLTFKGLWSSYDVAIQYTETAVTIHRYGATRGSSGKLCYVAPIRDELKLSPKTA